MTKVKEVAKTLKSTINNPIIAKIIDKSCSIDNIIDTVKNYWGYDLFTRKPGPAYKKGVFVGTDLDLAVFLYALIGRDAVINIPSYKSMRQTKVTEGVMLSSKENRHGQLLSLVSNKNTFIFSIKVKDMNVMSSEEVGGFRTFSLTTFDGSWYSGWKNLQFMPSAKENAFLAKTAIVTDNSIIFKNFIHPNRWTSMYGQYYFITKLLIDRLTAEGAHYNKEIKRMLAEGVEYPDEAPAKKWPASTPAGDKKSITVDAFVAEVDFPDDGSEFITYENTVDNLVDLTAKRKYYVYNVSPHLRFMTRATEQAFNNHIMDKGINVMPSWFQNVTWEEGYKEKGKRIAWNRLVLYQPEVGKRAVAIRFRKWAKSEEVDITYKG